MVNKKSLWFLTLFSLILVLSIYYITMPSELLLTGNINTDDITEPTIDITESSILVALRVEDDEKVSKEIQDLQVVLTNSQTSIEEKNKAYEKIRELNDIRGEEEKLESQIKQTYNFDSFIKIKGNHISVTVNSDKHDNTLANNIMRTIQANYNDSRYITVKFQK